MCGMIGVSVVDRAGSHHNGDGLALLLFRVTFGGEKGMIGIYH
jgi:hypothetical protein